MTDPSGWGAYEKLVIDKLDTLEAEVEALHEQIVLVRIDVAQLKIKAGLWGATAGMIPALVTAILAITGGP